MCFPTNQLGICVACLGLNNCVWTQIVARSLRTMIMSVFLLFVFFFLGMVGGVIRMWVFVWVWVYVLACWQTIFYNFVFFFKPGNNHNTNV